ncbi:MAG: helix-turn-helix domain-containing protein [Lactobacillales bacterium]|jgi:IS30 family transposase|nr:helix-turn-helix domain-containing protein [Lactobacillales bacterium]
MSHYNHLSISEREFILKWESNGIRWISRQLARSPSTISRELKQNKIDGEKGSC